MRDCDNCICLTKNGGCTRDAHDEIVKGKKVIVGMRRCHVFDGVKDYCSIYHSSNYYHSDTYESHEVCTKK